jgi:hypothetical protein
MVVLVAGVVLPLNAPVVDGHADRDSSAGRKNTAKFEKHFQRSLDVLKGVIGDHDIHSFVGDVADVRMGLFDPGGGLGSGYGVRFDADSPRAGKVGKQGSVAASEIEDRVARVHVGRELARVDPPAPPAAGMLVSEVLLAVLSRVV